MAEKNSRHCKQCLLPIIGRKTKFCSPSCREINYRNRPIENERCCVCGSQLTEENWNIGNKKVRRMICKSCHAARQKASEANREPDKIKRNALKNERRIKRENSWSAERKGKERRQRHEAWLRRAYGINLVKYDDLLKSQGGKCCICLSELPSGRGTFHVDHDHRTGRVRGLLCQLCNTGIGKLKEDVSIMERAIKYLKREDFGEPQ